MLSYMLGKSGLVMTLFFCVDRYVCSVRGCDDTIAVFTEKSIVSGSVMTLLLSVDRYVTVSVAVMTVLLCVDRYVGCIGGCDDTLVELFDLNKTLRRNPPPPAGKVTTCPIEMSHLGASESVSIDDTNHSLFIIKYLLLTIFLTSKVQSTLLWVDMYR